MQIKKYLFSVPERIVKSALVLSGGTIYEIMNLSLPKSMRSTSIYNATVNRFFQLIVEVLGGAKGTITKETLSGKEFAKRKTAGNILEALSFLSWGISPIWFFAILSDLTGGTKGFLNELVIELKEQGIIDQKADPKKINDLLELVKDKSAIISENFDLPPLNQKQFNIFYQTLKQKKEALPKNEELEVIYEDMRIISRDEKKSFREISILLLISLKKSGLKYSDELIFQYYRDTLKTIKEQGMLKFMYQRFKPYFKQIGKNFHPHKKMLTDRIFNQNRK